MLIAQLVQRRRKKGKAPPGLKWTPTIEAGWLVSRTKKRECGPATSASKPPLAFAQD